MVENFALETAWLILLFQVCVYIYQSKLEIF